MDDSDDLRHVLSDSVARNSGHLHRLEFIVAQQNFHQDAQLAADAFFDLRKQEEAVNGILLPGTLVGFYRLLLGEFLFQSRNIGKRRLHNAEMCQFLSREDQLVPYSMTHQRVARPLTHLIPVLLMRPSNEFADVGFVQTVSDAVFVLKVSFCLFGAQHGDDFLALLFGKFRDMQHVARVFQQVNVAEPE